MSRSRLSLLATVAVAAVIAIVVLRNASDPRPTTDRQHASETAPAARIDVRAQGPAPTPEQPDAERAAVEAARLATARAEQALALAAELRHKARFPRTSRRIEDNLDPIVKTRTVEERLSPPGQGREPTLVVFSSAFSYEAPTPIIIFAKFIRQYPNDWVPLTDAEIVGEITNAADEVVAEVDLRDDGQDRDLEARDGVFTAQLTPPAEELERWTGLLRVKIWGETVDGERRSARTRFYYGAPSARLTGNYRDELVDGHLRLLAEVDVTQEGSYRLDATLSGAHGLLAWAANTMHLEPGIRWMPVNFWGLALREANEPGPYRLSTVALANVSATPPQLNDAAGTTYQTAAYDPRSFSDQRYDDPRLLDKADRVEAKARGETARVD